MMVPMWNAYQCWVHPSPHRSLGYGMVSVGGRTGKKLYAHRVAYEFLVGAIPDGLQLDHLCRNRACYNPRHLEPVTAGENKTRGWAARRSPTCPQGHSEFGVNQGKRRCLACHREKERARRVLQA